MTSHLDFYMLLAGLGMFLYGMTVLEDSLKKLAGPKLKTFLKKNTSTPFKGILTGAFITTILQSSSLVSLMILAFVGAGLMSLQSAVGVIFGANLGTTATGWIFSFIGFKLSIKNVAFSMLGFGALIHTFYSNKPRLKYFSLTLIGLALLFSGLDFMKTSISELGNSFNIKSYADYGPYQFFFVGLILTAIIQSSSATMVITLSALNAGVISFESATGIVIGADIGTTLTVFLGTINASGDKKRVALSHFLFNFITMIVALILLKPLIAFIGLIGIKDPLIGIVFFHSMFNMIGITLFFPFIGKFSDFLSKRFVEDKERTLYHLEHISPADSPEINQVLAEKEVEAFINRTVYLSCKLLGLHKELINSLELEDQYKEGLLGLEGYEKLKDSQNEILDFCMKSLSHNEVLPAVTSRYAILIESTRRAGTALKNIKDVTYNIEDNRSLLVDQFEFVYQEVIKSFEYSFLELFKIIHNEPNKKDPEEFEKFCLTQRENLFNLSYRQVATSHVEKVLIGTFLNIIREVFGSLKQFNRSLQVMRKGKLSWPKVEEVEQAISENTEHDHP
ncbi:MAG: Na/Pi cotransporter family protein [Deltaproteobacteria bacterium]|nr:MAG: Na/Pi cotransporter family protein [Deltaproteobacteria bacterium]TNF29794.1 MAG: Na/Pi cotransporter family protein [Deltaproteobacteria bacterium]